MEKYHKERKEREPIAREFEKLFIGKCRKIQNGNKWNRIMKIAWNTNKTPPYIFYEALKYMLQDYEDELEDWCVLWVPFELEPEKRMYQIHLLRKDEVRKNQMFIVTKEFVPFRFK